MKKLLYLSLILFLGLNSCSKPDQLTFKNTLDEERNDETIILKRADIESRFGKIEKGIAPVLKAGDEWFHPRLMTLTVMAIGMNWRQP